MGGQVSFATTVEHFVCRDNPSKSATGNKLTYQGIEAWVFEAATTA
jgi:hypothetical protein